MRTREEILLSNSTGDGDSEWQAVEGMEEVLEVLLDIRDLLSQGKGEEVVISENKVPERCTNCENDNHYSCTGCRCHADY